MRISPKSLSPAEALAKAKSKIAAREEDRREAQELLFDAQPEAEEAAISPGAIDASRAQRLLERAASLAERGDMGAAILATRQSLALAPDGIEGHLLHARLLERNRDFGGARAAYEKAVQLAPDHKDARDNLTRLDAYLQKSQGAARQFHFDDDELFSPGSEAGAPTKSETASPIEAAAPQAATAPESTPIVAVSAASAALEVDVTSLLDESMLPAIEARVPPTRASTEPLELGEKSGAQAPAQSAFMAGAAEDMERISADAAPVDERRKHNTPVATERRHRPSVAMGAAPVVAAPLVPRTAATPSRPAPMNPANSPFDASSPVSAPVVSRAPLMLDVPTAPTAPLWQQMASRPSFYARTLPLVGVALLSLGFLSWARGRAVSQVVAPASTTLASANDFGTNGVPNPAPAAKDPAQPDASAPATDGGGVPISNAPFSRQAPAATGAAAANSPATGAANGARTTNNRAPATARANNRGGNARPNRSVPSPRPVPSFPNVTLAPAPIPPASVRRTLPSSSAPRGDNGGNIILPSPSIEMQNAPAPRSRVLPPADSPLNPAGSPNRGYVRVTEGRVGNGVIPSQPSAVARDNERAANDAARNGQNDQAISQLSQAIRADSDNAGFRYQQRATLFLQRGDYSRATDDFQSAISAYQNQIGKGDDVAAARRGLSAARSGLNLALAGRRG